LNETGGAACGFGAERGVVVVLGERSDVLGVDDFGAVRGAGAA
jgi:hypothetical protein